MKTFLKWLFLLPFCFCGGLAGVYILCKLRGEIFTVSIQDGVIFFLSSFFIAFWIVKTTKR